jgi:multiple sugar transport system substrate-binding protein
MVPQTAIAATHTHSSTTTVTLTEEDYYGQEPGNTYWNNAFAEYSKTHPGVVIERTVVPQADFVPHLLSQASSGDMPDLVQIDNPFVPEFAKAGVLTPLKSIGPINVSDVAPTELYGGIYKGTLYTIPPFTNTLALAYNKAIFAAAHLNPPATWAQLVSDAKALTTPTRYGFEVDLPAAAGGAFWVMAPFLWTSAGADATSHLNSPQAIAALNLFVQMERDGSMPKAEVSWIGEQETEYFETGKAAMTLNGPWEISTLDAVKGLDYGTVPIPTPVAGQKLLVATGGETWGIPVTDSAAQKTAALGVLNWMLSPQQDAAEALGQGGYIPTVKAADPLFLAKVDRVQIAPYVTELQNGGTPRTLYTGTAFSQVATTVGNAVDAAVSGQETAQQAFDSIAPQVQSELKAAGE